MTATIVDTREARSLDLSGDRPGGRWKGTALGDGLPRRKIAITGSRDVSSVRRDGLRTAFEDATATVGARSSSFLVGASVGIDQAFIRWRRDSPRPDVTVVLPGRAPDPPSEDLGGCSVIELDLPGHPSRATFRERENWMLRRCEFVIAFPADAEPTSGTQYVIDLARTLRLPTLVVPLGRRPTSVDR